MTGAEPHGGPYESALRPDGSRFGDRDPLRACLHRDSCPAHHCTRGHILHDLGERFLLHGPSAIRACAVCPSAHE